MDYLHVLVLAIIEGITEFLPVSSTGHMIIASSFFGIAHEDFTKLFTIVIQLGAILSVVVLYFKRFFQTIAFYFKLLAAFIPAVILGLLFSKKIDALLENPITVAVSLLIGGIVLLKSKEGSHSGWDAADAEIEGWKPSFFEKIEINITECNTSDIMNKLDISFQNSPLFVKDGVLVRVVNGELFQADPYWLMVESSRVARIVKEVKGKLIETSLPIQKCMAYVARKGEWEIRNLNRVVYAPTIRDDGSILVKKGYDKSGLWLHSDLKCDIPANPTLTDAINSAAIFMDLLSDFPFVSPIDNSVVISAILTGLVRANITNAPLFGFTAPTMASGKSLLCDVVSLICYGHRSPSWNYTGNDEEERKHLTGALLSGTPIITIDNVSTSINSDRLCSTLTSPKIRDRLLGSTNEVTISTNVLFMINGNNLQIKGDLSTRSLLCRLDAGMESPGERRFNRNLLKFIPENRARLVSAGLTILKAYKCAGSPSNGLKEFGRFEEWSNFVRNAIVWVGLSDPVESVKFIMEDDPVKQMNQTTLIALSDFYHKAEFTVSDILNDTAKNINGFVTPLGGELYSAIMQIAGKGDRIDARLLGRALAKLHGCVINDMKLVIVGKTHGYKRYVVEKTV